MECAQADDENSRGTSIRTMRHGSMMNVYRAPKKIQAIHGRYVYGIAYVSARGGAPMESTQG